MTSGTSAESSRQAWAVEPGDAGARLDVWLAARLDACSRSRARGLIEEGYVTVDGAAAKPAVRLRPGQAVKATVPAPRPALPAAEAIRLDVVYEDSDLLVLDKPAGLVVHPAPGHPAGTLVNALLHHCDRLAGIGGVERPGIVHRLDKDTSGLLVVAKNDAAMAGLTRQFAAGRVEKTYLALVHGQPPACGRLDGAIGRHSRDRKRMAVVARGGKAALTAFETVCRYPVAALLRVRIATGRTHQIRVHLAHARLPVAGDPVYGDARRDRSLPERPLRQMLHAARLAFAHPRGGRRLEFERPPPADMRRVLERLDAESRESNRGNSRQGERIYTAPPQPQIAES